MSIPGLQRGVLTISNNVITDHNRAPLTISNERIETRTRMVDGTLRVNFIATKLRVSASWDLVPSLGTQCVDNRTGSTVFGGQELKNLYETSNGNPLTVRITSKSSAGDYVEKQMVFASFEYTVAKRGPHFDLVNMSVELEEV